METFGASNDVVSVWELVSLFLLCGGSGRVLWFGEDLQ